MVSVRQGCTKKGQPLQHQCLPISHPLSSVATPVTGKACSRPLWVCAGGERCELTVKQPIRLCSKGRWKALGSPHQSNSSVAALWKLAGFCKCCGRGKRRNHEATETRAAQIVMGSGVGKTLGLTGDLWKGADLINKLSPTPSYVPPLWISASSLTPGRRGLAAPL